MEQEVTTLPYHPEAERYILGGILRDPELLGEVADSLTEEDFYIPSHKRIYSAILSLFHRGDPVDVVSVSNEIGIEHWGEIGGSEYLTELYINTPLGVDIPHYVQIVKEKSLRRKLFRIAEETARLSRSSEENLESLLVLVERQVFQLSQEQMKGGYRPIKEYITETLNNLEAYYKDEGIRGGLPTSFYELDEYTNGFQNGDLIIIAGRPGMGKTAFILNIATHVAEKTGKGVLFFSLEMSGEQLTLRALCSRAKVDLNRLRKRHLAGEMWGKVIRAGEELMRFPIYIDDSTHLTVPMMLSKARRLKTSLKRENPPREMGMIVVDYLQLLVSETRAERRDLEIAMITRGLKMMAKEIDVPVVALSQLNRGVESRSDKRPLLSDLRESGSIEQDADLILFLYRDEMYNRDSPEKGIAEVIIGKQRNGPTGAFKLRFTPSYLTFENLDLRHEEPAF